MSFAVNHLVHSVLATAAIYCVLRHFVDFRSWWLANQKVLLQLFKCLLFQMKPIKFALINIFIVHHNVCFEKIPNVRFFSLHNRQKKTKKFSIPDTHLFHRMPWAMSHSQEVNNLKVCFVWWYLPKYVYPMKKGLTKINEGILFSTL